MSARIPQLSPDDAQQIAQSFGVPKQKTAISLYRILLQQPMLAKRINDLLETLSTDGTFDARLRELVVLRIGWQNNGVYEWSLHWSIALQLGVTEEELVGVKNWPEHDHWSAADRAAFQAADDIVATGVMSESTWVAFARAFRSSEDRLDLMAIILTWKMISDLIKNLAVPLDDGFAAWPPSGEAP